MYQLAYEQIKGRSLAEVEKLARDRDISELTITLYLEAWNATPGRFTSARWNGSYFAQYCNECKARCTVNGCKCEG
jgi:hypothetical protein